MGNNVSRLPMRARQMAKPAQQMSVPTQPGLMGSPVQQDGWVWDGERWVCDPCDGFPQPPCPNPGWPTPCPPWFGPPAGQAPWYPGANGGVSFSSTAPVNPIRGNFWWNGVVLSMFDGAAWVVIGPTAGAGGPATGPTPPASPVNGMLWFDGQALFVWDGVAWVPVEQTQSTVSPTAPTNPSPGDTWFDGTTQHIWNGTQWVVIGQAGTSGSPSGARSIAPVLIPWSANIIPDFSQFINAYINVTGNFILGSPINVTPGQTGIIKLNQDVVGGHTWLVSPGWYFLGGTGAPVLSTGANAKDLLHYYVGEQNVVYGELHVDFMSNSGPTAPPVVTKTPFGNMTLNGGLAASFDGVTMKTGAASSRASTTQSSGTFSGYVGENYTTAQRCLSATYWIPTDEAAGGGNFGSSTLYTVVVNLRGLVGSTPPASATAGTLLASVSLGSPTGSGGSKSLVPSDQTTAYNYLWVEVALTYTGGTSTELDVFCAQLQLDVHT